jgi:hypothetical protein
MSIFDDIVRENDQPRQEGEPLFSYLNKSSRPEAERIRALIDEWIGEYPETHREGLAARLRSDIDDQHQSAFFELFLHKFLRARGCKIIEIEPKLEHTNKSPDFLVETSAGERFYLEAVLASGRSNQETAAYARLNTALAAIDNVPSPGNFLSLTTDGLPTAPLSLKKLKRALQSWIAGLPAGKAAKDAAAFKYEEHRCNIELRALPRSTPGEDGRAIGMDHAASRNPPRTQKEGVSLRRARPPIRRGDQLPVDAPPRRRRGRCFVGRTVCRIYTYGGWDAQGGAPPKAGRHLVRPAEWSAPKHAHERRARFLSDRRLEFRAQKWLAHPQSLGGQTDTSTELRDSRAAPHKRYLSTLSGPACRSASRHARAMA